MVKRLPFNRLLSLGLAILLVVSLFPTSAMAADVTDETHAHEEAAETVESAALLSGTVGESAVTWSFVESTGHLMISGSGDCARFSSADDQPWAHLRGEIREVWFSGMDALSITDLAYWFEGCTALTCAEIPYTTSVIGTDAFANCPSLTAVNFYYYDTDSFTITPGAFASDSSVQTEIRLITTQQSTIFKIAEYDWDADNRAVSYFDVYSYGHLADCMLGACTCSSCSSYTDVFPDDEEEHRYYVCCSGCDAMFWLRNEAHSFTGGYCTVCGESEPAPSVCYHYSTYKSYSGCYWDEYCNDCGAWIDSGGSHSYSYGSWQYYSTSQHRREQTCSSCGDTTYDYGSHSTSTKYEKYSDAQHKTGRYCSSCSSYVGSTSYANHSLTYGSWSSYSASQHRRAKNCSLCGYSGYEYANHSLTYDAWSSVDDSQHKRTASCSCGYSTTETGSHADTNSDGSCDSCGYLMARFSVTVPASLTLAVSKHGEVFCAEDVAIVNNSTAAVKVSGVTANAVNGWTLVPYETNMANVKVNARHIGLFLNGAVTLATGTTEALALGSGWTIEKGEELPLNCDAVVSAYSEPVEEQVLTLVFVLNWA